VEMIPMRTILMLYGKKALFSPVISIILVIALVIASYFLIVGGASRFAPIFAKMGLINASEATDQGEQARIAEMKNIPPQDRVAVEQAIQSIKDSIESCRNTVWESSPCSCDLTVPSLPQGYIIRVMDTGNYGSSFIAGFKANWNNGEEAPVGGPIMPTTLPLSMSCFSSTLWDEFASSGSGREAAAQDPKRAIGTLHAIGENLYNLERRHEDGRLYVTVPARYAQCDPWLQSPQAKEYHVVGADWNDKTHFRMLRLVPEEACLIVDREDDFNSCYAGVEESNSPSFFEVAKDLPRCRLNPPDPDHAPVASNAPIE